MTTTTLPGRLIEATRCQYDPVTQVIQPFEEQGENALAWARWLAQDAGATIEVLSPLLGWEPYTHLISYDVPDALRRGYLLVELRPEAR